MSDDWREELVQKMARHIAVSDDTTPDPNSEWCDQNWHCWIPEARAALVAAEPVIRERVELELCEENVRLNSELSEERERVTVLEDELFLLEQKDCNEENYLQSQLDAVVIERNTLREENARLREALKVAAGFLGDAYKDIGRDEYKVAEFVARSAAAAIRETGDE